MPGGRDDEEAVLLDIRAVFEKGFGVAYCPTAKWRFLAIAFIGDVFGTK